MSENTVELPENGGIVLTIELEVDVYIRLLRAANEAGVGVAEFASGVIANYMEDNYAQV